VPSSSTTRSDSGPPRDEVAAREGLAHRRRAGVIAVEGPDRAAFLQGQLTQDVRGLEPGGSRPAAALTPRGKLLYVGVLAADADRLLLLLPAEAAEATVAHFAKYAAFQKVTVRDATADYARYALYGPRAVDVSAPPGALRLPPEGEIAGEIVAPVSVEPVIRDALSAAGSTEVSEQTAEVLRVEAGRPRWAQDATSDNVPAEVGLDAAVSSTKGCYVGQEIVARMRTYGKASRHLVGFTFPDGPVAAGTRFPDPGKPERELGRVTSSVVSPRFGPIGMGFVARDVVDGAVLTTPDAGLSAIVRELPFS
jgi:tRNA-modifying protein YgfZ